MSSFVCFSLLIVSSEASASGNVYYKESGQWRSFSEAPYVRFPYAWQMARRQEGALCFNTLNEMLVDRLPSHLAVPQH